MRVEEESGKVSGNRGGGKRLLGYRGEYRVFGGAKVIGERGKKKSLSGW